MDNKLLLAKCLTLLYRESTLSDRVENSVEIVRTVLSDIKVMEVSIGINTEKEVVLALKDTILEMCGQPQDHTYSLPDLLQRIRINCGHDEKLYEAMAQSLKDSVSMDEKQIKHSIVNTRQSISNHYRTQKISALLRKASGAFTYEIDSIKDVNQYIAELTTELEALTIQTSAKDPAVMEEIDIHDETKLQQVFEAAKDNGSSSRIYKVLWDGMTEMTQGGFRAGETTIISALPHKYKTGTALTLFSQIARANTPKTQDPTKKPLLLRISFEDSLMSNLQFLYQHLRYTETGEDVDVSKIDTEEMASYVKMHLQATGFTIKMLRVDPTQWTYKSVFNKILDLEAQGYAIEVLMLDYMALLPTTGCINTGPSGTDLRDMLRRFRNLAASKGICLISPHQVSAEAKNMLRGGIPEANFLKEIAEKGYYAGSKQLDQEIDLDLYVHLFKQNKETYLAVQRGKHRLPTVIPDEKKSFYMKFPKKMPIPDSKPGEPIMRRISSVSETASFEFD